MPSPTPMNRTGRPSRCLTATTQPPLAVPSSLVRMMPVAFAALQNSRAWLMAFWPVMASSTSRVSRLASGLAFLTLRLILESSAIRFALLCRRPAVSAMTRS